MGETKRGQGKGREAALTEAITSVLSTYADEGTEVDAVTAKRLTEGLYRVVVYRHGEPAPDVELVIKDVPVPSSSGRTATGGSSGSSVPG